MQSGFRRGAVGSSAAWSKCILGRLTRQVRDADWPATSILAPKSELLELLSGVRRLPLKEASDLCEEHKAVLLVVIGYRQKGGVSKTRVGEILGLEVAPMLDDLL